MSRIAGLGMDLADLERVRQALQKNGEAFALRICTPDEWAYCRKHADPVPRLAARFAAKEAVAKALGTGIGAKCAFTDVE
ncbi:MAG: holo-ACP synthase, partial [Akkermansia sp.]